MSSAGQAADGPRATEGSAWPFRIGLVLQSVFWTAMFLLLVLAFVSRLEVTDFRYVLF